eukprot:TRINITY_DN2248_c0_g1_i1.p1 TRINITY_DN2248_c0_g1~~TRINITY_DN2248_c0_g1_i1.p1  ORF type:complete len:401 (+),score=110.71 TRINITY_DN2248_c0_g1_i1:66-1268(+)
MRPNDREWSCDVCSARLDLLCPDCFQLHVSRARAQLEALSQARADVKQETTKLLAANEEPLGSLLHGDELRVEADHLREELLKLSQQVATERVQLAARAFAAVDAEAALAAAHAAFAASTRRQEAEQQAVDGGLAWYASLREAVLRQRRLQRVLQLYILLPLEVSIDSGAEPEGLNDGNLQVEVIRRGPVGGVGAIAGLPLPHNGAYASVPDNVLVSALFLIARLVEGIANFMDMKLPHPLKTGYASGRGYAAISSGAGGGAASEEYPLCPPHTVAEGGVIGGKAYSSEGAFETALDMLRSDVVTLCVQGAGVPVDRLWPAEALLLNLWELHKHVGQQLAASTAAPETMPGTATMGSHPDTRNAPPDNAAAAAAGGSAQQLLSPQLNDEDGGYAFVVMRR